MVYTTMKCSILKCCLSSVCIHCQLFLLELVMDLGRTWKSLMTSSQLVNSIIFRFKPERIQLVIVFKFVIQSGGKSFICLFFCSLSILLLLWARTKVLLKKKLHLLLLPWWRSQSNIRQPENLAFWGMECFIFSCGWWLVIYNMLRERIWQQFCWRP